VTGWKSTARCSSIQKKCGGQGRRSVKTLDFIGNLASDRAAAAFSGRFPIKSIILYLALMCLVRAARRKPLIFPLLTHPDRLCSGRRKKGMIFIPNPFFWNVILNIVFFWQHSFNFLSVSEDVDSSFQFALGRAQGAIAVLRVLRRMEVATLCGAIRLRLLRPWASHYPLHFLLLVQSSPSLVR
jgi:hypothetical protein